MVLLVLAIVWGVLLVIVVADALRRRPLGLGRQLPPTSERSGEGDAHQGRSCEPPPWAGSGPRHPCLSLRLDASPNRGAGRTHPQRVLPVGTDRPVRGPCGDATTPEPKASPRRSHRTHGGRRGLVRPRRRGRRVDDVAGAAALRHRARHVHRPSRSNAQPRPREGGEAHLPARRGRVAGARIASRRDGYDFGTPGYDLDFRRAAN